MLEPERHPYIRVISLAQTHESLFVFLHEELHQVVADAPNGLASGRRIGQFVCLGKIAIVLRKCKARLDGDRCDSIVGNATQMWKAAMPLDDRLKRRLFVPFVFRSNLRDLAENQDVLVSLFHQKADELAQELVSATPPQNKNRNFKKLPGRPSPAVGLGYSKKNLYFFFFGGAAEK